MRAIANTRQSVPPGAIFSLPYRKQKRSIRICIWDATSEGDDPGDLLMHFLLQGYLGTRADSKRGGWGRGSNKRTCAMELDQILTRTRLIKSDNTFFVCFGSPRKTREFIGLSQILRKRVLSVVNMEMTDTEWLYTLLIIKLKSSSKALATSLAKIFHASCTCPWRREIVSFDRSFRHWDVLCGSRAAVLIWG
ncbi:hypothetical protein TNCV_223651 [Trichonephila clavipes]|nr:hypothetical protein TNCV_223651 [Trichonephila clavipes]